LQVRPDKINTHFESQEGLGITHLYTTLAQGSGFGLMSSIIDMISKNSKAENGVRMVDPEVFDLLIENNKHTKTVLRGLSNAVDIINLDFNFEVLSTKWVDQLIQETCVSLNEIIDSCNLKLKLKTSATDFPLLLHRSSFVLCIKELLLNAIKYAPPQTNIIVDTIQKKDQFSISIQNAIRNDNYGDISDDFQSKLILPFIRMQPPNENFYHLEPFSLGLGLTLVNLIANRHSGNFLFRKFEKSPSEEFSICATAELILPIQNQSA